MTQKRLRTTQLGKRVGEMYTQPAQLVNGIFALRELLHHVFIIFKLVLPFVVSFRNELSNLGSYQKKGMLEKIKRWILNLGKTVRASPGYYKS